MTTTMSSVGTLSPLRGDFGDNYYYQMADIIRRFKGVSQQPVYSKTHKVSLDDLSTWEKVDAEYIDDRGDSSIGIITVMVTGWVS